MKSFSRVWLLAIPWTAAYQAPLSVGFSRQEYWSGVPVSSPRKEACFTCCRQFCRMGKRFYKLASVSFSFFWVNWYQICSIWDFCHWMSFSSRFRYLYNVFLVFKILKGIWERWLGGLWTSSYLCRGKTVIVSNNLIQSCLFSLSLFEFLIYLK